MEQIMAAGTEEPSEGAGKVKGEGEEFYEVEYSIPAEEEEEEEEEEDGDSVFVIEYSNPEEEGESYQFTMSVDRPPPNRRPITRPALKSALVPKAVTSSSSWRPRQKRKTMRGEEEEEEEAGQRMVSNQSVLALGEDYRDVMDPGNRKQLLCMFCPPPRRLFKRPAGLAAHLKQIHLMEGKKTFFCSTCKQTLRSQVELDTHTRRHATRHAVFTCPLCSATPTVEGAGFKGSKLGLKRHLEKQHPGVVPRCHICARGFRTLASFLADQFRHVGVSPFYCPRCQIYEMTERGLSVHTRNHDKKQQQQEETKKKEEKEEEGATQKHLPPPEGATSALTDNSATDDSDF